jgi:hypothetical protein
MKRTGFAGQDWACTSEAASSPSASRIVLI